MWWYRSTTISRSLFGALVVLVALPVSAYVAAGTNYRIQFDSINFGGGASDGTSYSQESTLGEVGTGAITGTARYASIGYLQTFPAAPICNNDSICSGSETAENCPNDCRKKGGGGPPPPSLKGCKDPLAYNYNAQAVVSDPSQCQYLALPVINLTRTINGNTGSLSWQNPANQQGFSYAYTVVRRSTSAFPQTISSGTAVYSGTGTTIAESNLVAGVTYYYSVFTVNQQGLASIAVVTTLSIPTSEEDTSPPDDVFTELPESPFAPLVTSPELAFLFSQPSFQELFTGGQITVRGDELLEISVPYDSLPEVLKSIGVTLTDPRDPSKTFSFLLRVDTEKRRYTATLAPFTDSGSYPMTVHIFDYENRRLKTIQGTLVVRGSVQPLVAVARIAGPLAILLGLAAGLLNMLFTLTRSSSLYDFYLSLVRAMGTLFGFFGFRKKRVPWGTAYDAVTKRPLDPAYIAALRWGKEYASAITDLDGRYNFVLPPGIYELSAKKTHYRFPSTLLAGKKSDAVYDNLYFGGEFVVGEGELVTRNIPLDPIGFDWNEFIKNRAGFIHFHSQREVLRNRVANGLYALGFAAAVATLLMAPSFTNVVVLGCYFAITAVSSYFRVRHRLITVRTRSGEPLPFALVHFFIPGVEQEVKKVFTDQLGRFYQILSPGEYYLTVDELVAIGEYKQVYQSEPLSLPQGVLTGDIRLP